MSLTRGDEVPHALTRKSRLQPAEFLITSARRLLQQNLAEADVIRRRRSECFREKFEALQLSTFATKSARRPGAEAMARDGDCSIASPQPAVRPSTTYAFDFGAFTISGAPGY